MSFRSEAEPDLLGPASHRESLLRLAAQYLQAGKFKNAFKVADRFCRLTPSAHGHVLRGEALAGLQDRSGAEHDFYEAFAIDPTDSLVNRRILSASDPVKRGHAARLVIEDPRSDPSSLRLALGVLWPEGVEAVVSMQAESGFLSGFAAWRRQDTILLEVSVERGEVPETVEILLRPARAHPLGADQTFAQDFQIDLRPKSVGGRSSGTMPRDLGKERADIRLVRLWIDHQPVRSFVSLRNYVESKPLQKPVSLIKSGAPPQRCTVVVPVFGDVEITSRCLHALSRQAPTKIPIQVVVVNDNPGDFAMADLTCDMAARFGFVLLVNDRNMGFVKSVNRALALAGDDDILLLNSDVLLPDQAVERLHAAAYQSPDIGTVTPLSNNGEDVSFPKPFHASDLGNGDDIALIDRAAASVNRDRIVTIQNGVGFCLYVKRDCLAATGLLSETYARGYFEDVELCLRAAEAGFRNVCATNVYAGHQGSSSFKADKQALVVRNSRILASRFPDYAEQSLGFAMADPLREARAAIELVLPPSEKISVLLVGDAGGDQTMRARTEDLDREGKGVLIGDVSRDMGHWIALRAPGGARPQSLRFDLGSVSDLQACFDYLGRLELAKIEMINGAAIPPALLDGLQQLGRPISMLLDANPIGQLGYRASSQCSEINETTPCRACYTAFIAMVENPSAAARERLESQRKMLTAAGQVTPLDPIAYAFAQHHNLKIDAEPRPRLEPAREMALSRKESFGILYPSMTSGGEALLIEVCRALCGDFEGAEVIVLGSTSNDLRIMGQGDVHVTGPIAATEYGEVLNRYGVRALFSPDRWCGYGLLADLGLKRDLPLCYFDWSFVFSEWRDGDLVLNPLLCDKKASALTARWWHSLN